MNRLVSSIVAFAVLLVEGRLDADTIVLSAVADTTLNQHSPNNNMGAHNQVLAGESGVPDARRGLFRFNVASSLPAGAVVSSASLTLTVEKAPQQSSNFDLFRALVGWTEGAGTTNQGSPATTGEPTWNARAYPATLWAAPGGLAGTDYAAASSGAKLISSTAGTYTWTGSGVAADVQFWLDHPTSNFGWFLISQAESTAFTACQIASREAASGVAPLLTIVFTPLNQWAGSAGGNWGDAAKWTAATVPNSNTATANFWGNAVSPATVDLQATSRTVKTLSFDNAGNSYTIVSSAGGQLNLAADSGPASVEVLHGSHQIAAAVNLSSPTTLSVANSGDALRLTGDLTGPAADVTKTGPGTVRIENAAGTAALIRSLTISAGAVDIQSGKVVIANKTLAGGMAAVRTQIASAYAGGAWTGAGLTSSAAAADFAANGGSAKFGVGYVNNADPAAGAKTTWQGRAVDSNSLLIQYTYYGDANLDGRVSLADLGILRANYGKGPMQNPQWHHGDFNYDSRVTLIDFNKLRAVYGAPPIAAGQSVPEPASSLLLAAAGLCGLVYAGRRRRVG